MAEAAGPSSGDTAGTAAAADASPASPASAQVSKPNDAKGIAGYLLEKILASQVGSIGDANALLEKTTERMAEFEQKLQKTHETFYSLQEAKSGLQNQLRNKLDDSLKEATQKGGDLRVHLERFFRYLDRLKSSYNPREKRGEKQYFRMLQDVIAEFELANGQLKEYFDCVKRVNNDRLQLVDQIESNVREVEKTTASTEQAGYSNAALKAGAAVAAATTIGGAVGFGIATYFGAQGFQQATSTYQQAQELKKMAEELKSFKESLGGCLNELQEFISKLQPLESEFRRFQTQLEAANRISTKEAKRYRKSKQKSKSLGDLASGEGDDVTDDGEPWRGSLHDLKYAMKKSNYKSLEERERKKKKKRCLIQ